MRAMCRGHQPAGQEIEVSRRSRPRARRSRSRGGAALSITAVIIALSACVDHRAAITGTQGLAVELVSPTDPGSVSNRLPDTERTVTLKISAYDANNNIDTSYNQTLQAYAHYLG